MTGATTSPVDVARLLPAGERAVFLFDDSCGVCLRFVSLISRGDHADRLRVAPLLSMFGDVVRRAHPQFGSHRSALFVTTDGTVLDRSDAILASLRTIGGAWAVFAKVVGVIPRRIRDVLYGAFATHRYLFASLMLSELDAPAARRQLSTFELQSDWRA